MWALGIDLRLLGLGASASIQRAISLAGSLVLTVDASKSFSADAIIWFTSWVLLLEVGSHFLVSHFRMCLGHYEYYVVVT